MSKIVINDTTYKHIPYNEYYKENEVHKGLVFVQHGFESNKNRGADYLALNLARLGFYVISVDAFKHGLRKEEPYITEPEYKRFKEAFKVIDNTGNDIITLHKDLFTEKFPLFDLVGVSMGGMIAYNVSLKYNRINKLIPVISTPILYEFAEWLVDRGDNTYQDTLKEVEDFIKEIDPSDKVNQLKYNKLHIINTTEDNIVPPIYSEKYFQKHKSENMSIKLFEDKHNVNRAMQENILEFIAEEKVVL